MIQNMQYYTMVFFIQKIDISVLENYHAASLFEILNDKKTNIVSQSVQRTYFALSTTYLWQTALSKLSQSLSPAFLISVLTLPKKGLHKSAASPAHNEGRGMNYCGARLRE